MLAPSTIKRAPDLVKKCAPLQNINVSSEEGQKLVRDLFPIAAFVQPCHSIPFHSEHPFDDSRFSGFAVVPTDGVAEPTALRDSTKRSYEALDWLRSLAPSPSAQSKYQKSHQWLYGIQQRWHEIAYWEERLRNEKQGA